MRLSLSDKACLCVNARRQGVKLISILCGYLNSYNYNALSLYLIFRSLFISYYHPISGLKGRCETEGAMDILDQQVAYLLIY